MVWKRWHRDTQRLFPVHLSEPGDHGEVSICPACASTDITPLTGHDTTDAYRCRACGAGFDTPESRKRRKAPSLRGPAKTLAEMDADEVLSSGDTPKT